MCRKSIISLIQKKNFEHFTVVIMQILIKICNMLDIHFAQFALRPLLRPYWVSSE